MQAAKKISIGGKDRVAKPFLKWAGGKSQLLQTFRNLYPVELIEGKLKHYYEPFLGSGAVFFDVMARFKIEQAFLYDINPELVLTYKVVQQAPQALIKRLAALEKKYLKLSKEERKSFYYKQRKAFNLQRAGFDYQKKTDTWIERAALLVFLNRTCYNGLYRVNSRGDFNSPAGDYNKPTICDSANLLAVSATLQKAQIQQADYSAVLRDLKTKSFVYFDPPYRPISKTASFKSYSALAFNDAEQQQLAVVFAQLHKKGAQLLLSNSDPKNTNPDDEFFDDLYTNYHILRVPAKRLINSNAGKRGNINEIVVTNYPAL